MRTIIHLLHILQLGATRQVSFGLFVRPLKKCLALKRTHALLYVMVVGQTLRIDVYYQTDLYMKLPFHALWAQVHHFHCLPYLSLLASIFHYQLSYHVGWLYCFPLFFGLLVTYAETMPSMKKATFRPVP